MIDSVADVPALIGAFEGQEVTMFDDAIVGAGILGLAHAYQLLQHTGPWLRGEYGPLGADIVRSVQKPQ